ncbi:MAG TPA: 5-formyltetrahydrofolate cyclo-ligase [Actinoplanes sp.]
MSDLPGEAEGSRTDKIALRSRLLTVRRSRNPSQLADAATALQDQIHALVRRQAPATVAAYVPSSSEPGGPGLPALLASLGRLLLPVLLPDDDLDWAEFTGPLAPGRRGLPEPTGPRLGVDAIRSADLVLVPALAVDRRGMRLGRGGGSYDRVLARLAPTATLIVALLHEGELVERVPAEPHDRPVHAVVTPSGVVSLIPAVEWTK